MREKCPLSRENSGCLGLLFAKLEGTLQMRPVSRDLDRLEVVFDDDHLVANAGLVLPGTLAQKLGVEAVTDRLVRLPGGAGHRPGRKLMTVVTGILAGGDCIDDVDVLRSGASDAALGHRVMAPSTVGTFLRAFTFGHVRQLDKVFETVLGQAWAVPGAGPGEDPLTVDIDSTITEVCGHHKQGASYGYTRVLGYHPLLAVRADTGEVLHCRFRAGRANSGRGAARFVDELVARLRRCGATGPVTLRADSGFWSAKVIARLNAHHVAYSITARRTSTVTRAVDAITEAAWQPLASYPAHSGVAQVAETVHEGARLIVRRVRHYDHRGRLPLEWRHLAFETNRAGTTAALDEDHRAHAIIELAIRDLKDGAGWNHCPSGRFNANAPWLAAGALAHNLMRWAARIGWAETGLTAAKTFRRQMIALPGRATTSARRFTLHLPARWPWQHRFEQALQRVRAVPPGGT